MRPRTELRAGEIVDVVIDLIDTEGYDAVQVRTVAKQARISLATLYNLFETRENLIAIALRKWMDANAYGALTMPQPGDSPYDTLVRVVRTVFTPWEQHPRMLEAYHRVQSSPSGQRLDLYGWDTVRPIAEAALEGADAEYLADLALICEHVHRAAIARFADGEIAVTDIVPIMERTLFRLTTDNRRPPPDASTVVAASKPSMNER
jgi:AcrR family transcriptional regulator